MSRILVGFAGTGRGFLCPLQFCPWVQCKTRTRARGQKEKPVPSPYRVFTRGHAGNLCPLPSLASLGLECCVQGIATR
jgi:hypothetical protein